MAQPAGISSTPRSVWVTFGTAFEALYLRAFADKVTPELKAKLKAMGLNLDKLDAAYPNSTWVNTLEVAGKTFFPSESPEIAYTKMGERLVESYFETLIGIPLLAISKLLGPHRTLGRMTKNFRTSNNYTETDLVQRGPHEYEMWVNEPGDSRYITLGVMQHGLRLTGSPKTKIELLSADDNGARFLIKLNG